MELISKYTASSEFADLHEEVQKAYEQAVGSDANLKTMLETTLTGAIKQWYTSSGIANLKKSDADTQTTEADTQQADDASQSGDQQTTDANAGQTADQQTTDANAANQQTAEQPQAPAEYQVVTKDVVKVRDGASTDAKELGLLKEQVTLTAYGTEGDWTIVSYSAGTNGRAYIKTENLQTVGQ